MHSPYDDLILRNRDISLLESSTAVLTWDQETMMPARGVEHRARQIAQLAKLAHERAVEPAVGDCLQACEELAEVQGDPDGVAAVNVRELRRSYERSRSVPTDLVVELAETTSLAQHEWAQARAASDFARFRPWLDKLLTLSRRRAECVGWAAGGEPFDALLEDFEPGATAAELQKLFRPLRERLGALLGELASPAARPPDDAFVHEQLPIPAQEEFVRAVVAQLGFDFERGRLDRSTHPFSIGIHPDDVRITTRFHEDNLLDALGSTMHEAGHGMYEQGLLAEHVGTPMAAAVSLGIHESQSRLWENQVGRSRAFWEWCQPMLARFFGNELARTYSPDRLFRTANLVRPHLIRVEADEATYNLHVMVRFELELALLRGEVAVDDIPGEWNRLYREYLDLEVPDDQRGCLQDVHWSCGMFGYFPTYTLGNLYSAQLFAAARRAVPDLDQQFARGEFGALRTWLNEQVHAHGKRYPARRLCSVVCGEPLSAEPFLTYLEEKLRTVHELD